MTLRDKLRNPAMLALLAGLVAVIAFAAATSGGWIYDDKPLIANNPYFHSFAHWPRWFVEDFWNLSEEFVRFEPRIIYWRPAISATYAFDWTVSGGAPAWFHITNLLWHALTTAMAFVVLRRWLGGAVMPAFVAAVGFAVHPTKAESVAWIAGRTDILCMLALLLVSEGIARRLAGKRGGLALEIAATLVAYMCKEQAIVLPAFAAIEYWVARGRPALDLRVVGQLLRGALPQLVVAIAYLALRHAFMPLESPGVKSGTLPLGEHALVVAESMGRYIQLTLAPIDLSVQQGLVRVENGEIVRSMPHVVLGIIGTLALVGGAIALRKRHPAVTLGIAFYLATILPTSNIVLSNMRTLISERFLFLPMFGIALVAGWALDRYRMRWLWGIVIACTVAAGVQSINRSADFRDEEMFWARELELHPESRQARSVLVSQLIDDRRYAAAMVELLKLTDASVVGDRVEVAFYLAQVGSGLVPDRDRAGLAAIDTYLAQLVEAKPGTATLTVRELQYHVAIGAPKYLAELPRFEARMLALRADLASRLGEDQRAVELARKILASCARCVNVGTLAALALARAGQYDEAMRVLDSLGDPQQTSGVRDMIAGATEARNRALTSHGPAQLQAQASELSALELWGRAYAVLAPHKDQIKHAPKFVMGFAELAVRAGDPAVAREVLAGQLAPTEIDAVIAEWSKKMGWQ